MNDERYEGRMEAFDAVAAFLLSKHTPDGLLERAVILDKIADLWSRAYGDLAAARRAAEDDSPLGRGTPVPEEATLPSGDARVAAL